ncbi:TonB-dependent receptor plug domain-containing protein, partial [candidate division KSB1 bacterium]
LSLLSGHVIETQQIEMLPVDDFMDIIAIQPGITRDLHIRGGRSTEVLFLVDGVPYTEAVGGAVGGMLPKSSILEMKIHTGGFDPEYGNAMSGVINIVTRRGTEQQMLTFRGDLDHYFNNPETNYASLGEVSMSGPIESINAHYFSATDFKTSYTRWQEDTKKFFKSPTLQELNNITKIDYDISENLRLNTQAIVSINRNRDYEFRWRRNLTGLPERKKQSYRLSVGLSQFITDNTFYNLNLSHYYLNSRLGPERKEDMDLTDFFQYDFYLQYIVDGSRIWWADETQRQWVMKADVTSQYSERNNLKIGVETTFYDMDIQRLKYEPQLTFFGKPLLNEEPIDYSTSYKYKPWSGSAYIQNKMRFVDDGTFTFGGRWDFLNPRAERPNLEWLPEAGNTYSKDIESWVPASVKHRFSPRIGVAMPLSDKDFFFVNMGYFFQVPLFDYLYSGLDINLKKKNAVLVGNPDMEPQVTRAYELSYRRLAREDLTLTVTGFYKDIQNLIDTKTFLASDSKALDDGYYAQYVNSPYANSKGLEVVLERHAPNLLHGRFSYTYMTAEGVSELDNEELRYIQWGFEPYNEFYPLSWDQRHTVSGVLSSDLPNRYTFDLILNYHSPRPYTYFPSSDGFTPPGTVLRPNNERMKHNLYLDLKATKTFEVLNSTLSEIMLYVDIRNLLDKKNVLWITSDGVIGGELRDPGAYDIGRRTRLGIELKFW